MSLSDKINMDRQEQIIFKKIIIKRNKEEDSVYKMEDTKYWITISFPVFCLFIWKKSSIGRKVVRGKEEGFAVDDGTLATFLLYNASTLL